LVGGGGIHVDLDVDVPVADARDLAVSRGATVLDEVLDQVCLDIPRDRYAAEVEFWSALTGWAVQDVDSPEFGRLERPRELPVRFLLQQLGEGSGTVRGHVDLACADVAGEVARHAGLGANTVGPGDGWVVMQDPNGQEYCCTGRDPLTGGTAPD
jgi:hypothetical protein